MDHPGDDLCSTNFLFYDREDDAPYTIRCQGRFVPDLVPELQKALRQRKIDCKKTLSLRNENKGADASVLEPAAMVLEGQGTLIGVWELEPEQKNRRATTALSLHHALRIALVADGPPGSQASLVFVTVSKDLPSSRYWNPSHQSAAAAAAAGGGGGEAVVAAAAAAAAAAADTKPCLESPTEAADTCERSLGDQSIAGGDIKLLGFILDTCDLKQLEKLYVADKLPLLFDMDILVRVKSLEDITQAKKWAEEDPFFFGINPEEDPGAAAELEDRAHYEIEFYQDQINSAEDLKNLPEGPCRCDMDHCQIKQRHLHRELLDGSQAVLVDLGASDDDEAAIMFFEVHPGVPKIAGVIHAPMFEVDFITRKEGHEAEVTQQVLSCYCRVEPTLCDIMDKRVWHRDWREEGRPEWVQPNTTYMGSLAATPSCCAGRALKVPEYAAAYAYSDRQYELQLQDQGQDARLHQLPDETDIVRLLCSKLRTLHKMHHLQRMRQRALLRDHAYLEDITMAAVLNLKSELESERLSSLIAAVSSAQAQGRDPPAALTQQNPTDPISPVDVGQARSKLVQPTFKEAESDPQAWPTYLSDVWRALGIRSPVLDSKPVADAGQSEAAGRGVHDAAQHSHHQQQQAAGSSSRSSEKPSEQQSQQQDEQQQDDQQQQVVGIVPVDQHQVCNAGQAAAAWCEQLNLRPIDLVSKLPGLNSVQPKQEDVPVGIYESAASSNKVITAATFAGEVLSYGVGATADEAAADASLKALARLLQAKQHEQRLGIDVFVQQAVNEIMGYKLWQEALAAKPGPVSTASGNAAAQVTQEGQQQQDQSEQYGTMQDLSDLVMVAVNTAAQQALNGRTAVQALKQGRAMRIDPAPASTMSPAATAAAEADSSSTAMRVHDGWQQWSCAVASAEQALEAAAAEGFVSLLLADCLYGLLCSASSH